MFAFLHTRCAVNFPNLLLSMHNVYCCYLLSGCKSRLRSSSPAGDGKSTPPSCECLELSSIYPHRPGLAPISPGKKWWQGDSSLVIVLTVWLPLLAQSSFVSGFVNPSSDLDFCFQFLSVALECLLLLPRLPVLRELRVLQAYHDFIHLYGEIANVSQRFVLPLLVSHCSGMCRVQGLEDTSESAEDQAQAKVCFEH
jgi:hypothetical protein